MPTDNDLRRRVGLQDKDATGSQNEKNKQVKKAASSSGGVGVMDVLRILGGLFLINCLLSYFITNDSVLWGYRPWFVRPAAVMRYFVRTPTPISYLIK